MSRENSLDPTSVDPSEDPDNALVDPSEDEATAHSAAAEDGSGELGLAGDGPNRIND
jgi:hypothetical protein